MPATVSDAVFKQREANRRSYYKHHEDRKAYYRKLTKSRRDKDPESYNLYNRKWQTAQRRRDGVPEKVFNTPDMAKQKAKDQYSRWARANPHVPAALAAKRRAIKRQATPLWVDFKAIEEIYEKAAKVSLETKIPHEVDHYYPLNSAVVCGLHCADNLRVITADENMRKGNKCP